MIDGQIKPNQVKDARILEAFLAVPREVFVPKPLQGVAYVDEDIEVAPGRYLMEPMVFARLLQAAEPRPGDVALDIGCVSGYSSAVLAQVVGAVVAVEEDPALADRATTLLAELGCDNVAVVQGPLRIGYPAQGPFDLIALNGTVEEVPEALFAQLAEGGRLVVVLGTQGLGKAVVYLKENGVIGRRELFDAAVAPLPGFQKPRRFTF